jgi:ABC-type sulfate/molybdate transport systems ATPase subunit
LLDIDLHKTLTSKRQTTKISCKAQFQNGEITALYGKSGSGKTTILRMIAGLEHPDDGTIFYGGVAWVDHISYVPLQERSVGLVFQDYNLFEHMSVERNLTFAADGNLSASLIELCDQIGIKELFDRCPNELSKGQQQKVAIIRSLALNNEVLLLDEPFSALDDDSIVEIIEILEKLRDQQNLAIVLVTHRKDVILKMADSVVILEKSEQGNPIDLIEKKF